MQKKRRSKKWFNDPGSFLNKAAALGAAAMVGQWMRSMDIQAVYYDRSVDPALLEVVVRGAETASDRVKFNAILFSQIRYLAEYFIRAMSAQGVVVAVLKQLQQMQAPARRLCDLFDTLETFAQEDQTYYERTFIDQPDTIGFKDAQVGTYSSAVAS